MPRKKDDAPTLVTKKTIAKPAAKRPVGRPKKTAAPEVAAAPKRRGRPPKVAAKVPVKKALPQARTSSLVNAKPLSSVAPAHPEQLLYESDILKEPIQPPKQPEKKERGKAAQDALAAVTAVSRRRAAAKLKDAQPEASPVKLEPPAEKQRPVPGPAANAQEVSVVSAAPSVLKQRRRQRARRVSIVLIAAAVLSASWYFGLHRSPTVEAENSQLVTQVGKLAVLPADETPSVTTVVDPTKVNQQFLKNAKKGDKVLLYFQAGQAIVYRPSTGQIVNMGPLETPKPRVFIRQGSPINNLSAVQSTITKTSDFLLASQDQSANKSYKQTVVVDLTGNRPDLAGKLAQLLHVQVVQLPAGEDRPDADLMVIVGSDFK